MDERGGFALVDAVQDGVSEIVTAVHGIIRFGPGEGCNHENVPIAERLLTGQAVPDDYAYMREHGWEMELLQ